MDKDKIRQKMLEDRMALSPEAAQKSGSMIQDKLLKSPFWPRKGNVGLYFPVKNEVMTQTLFQKALEEGLHVFFPRVEQGIRFYEANGPDDLEKGSWGIAEPKRHCPELPLDGVFDLIVVPGIVFSKDCFRIGYGKGFYDKFFSTLEDRVFTLALAYDFQIVESFDHKIWDKPVKAVLTEKRLYSREEA